MLLLAAVSAVLGGRADDDPATVLRQLLDDGRYSAAEALATEWRRTVERSRGSESLAAAEAADFLVDALVRNGKAAAAATVALAEETVQLKQRLGHTGDASVAVSLYNVGALRVERGELAAARQALTRALAIRRQTTPLPSGDLADTLDQLGLALIRAERFREAERRLQESLHIRDTANAALGRARTLYLLALLYRNDGKYTQALDRLEQAGQAQRTLRPDHPDRAQVAELRGDLFMLNVDATAAQTSWAAAQAIVERSLGRDYPAVARLERVRGLASLWDGQLDVARVLFARALDIGERVLAPSNEEYGALLGSSAVMKAADGEYVEARRLQSRALALHERCLGPTHSLTVTAIYNLADIAMQTGDLTESERLYTRAVRLWSHGLGPEHPYVARGLDALAEVVALRGQPVRSRDLYLRALAIRRRTLGPDHPDVAWTLMNLARMNAASGDVATAFTQINDAIRIYQRGRASQSPDSFARALVVRGGIDMRRADYDAARQSFTQALVIRERTFGPQHPFSAEARAGLAVADRALGANREALALALTAEEIGRDHLRQTIRYLPERQALGYAATRPRGLDLAISVAADRVDDQAEAVFDALIRSRGIVLDELATRMRSDGADPALASAGGIVAAARERFANLNYRSLRGDDSVSPALLAQAQRHKEDVERELAEKSAGTPGDLTRSRVGLGDVRRALPPSAALVSYARYERVTRVTRQHRTILRRTPSYVAFVVRSDSATVQLVPIGSAASVDGLIDAWRAEVTGHSRHASAGPVDAERTYRGVGVALRSKVWDPLLDYLRGASHILIVPDGMLNVVAFAALPIEGSRYLVENGPTLHYLSTERDVVPLAPVTAGRGLLAIGGASFDAAPSSHRTSLTLRSGCEAPEALLRFEPLTMAFQEAQDVAGVWSLAARPSGSAAGDAMVLSGKAATERAVVEAMKGRRIVHLATHGFFLDRCAAGARGSGGVGSDLVRATLKAENPLLFSGLALTGAGTTASRGADDGILTAEEVAALNLQGTDWAVLSACDTGVGEIRAGEGVFGLRRAFQVAGVRTVIMSLWSVQDQGTRSWMRALYESRFTNGESTDRAVADASLTILRDRRAHGQSTHPFYWAAFVAVGEWR